MATLKQKDDAVFVLCDCKDVHRIKLIDGKPVLDTVKGKKPKPKEKEKSFLERIFSGGNEPETETETETETEETNDDSIESLFKD